MSEFNITPEKVELENGDIEIVRLNNNLIFRDNAQGITLTIDQDTELSQLWNAFDSQIDTSQFFQENASGLAELLSGYAGLDLAGEDIENANVVNASTGEFGSVNTDDLNGIVLVESGDDLQTKLDEGGSGSLVLVKPGTYESSSRFKLYTDQTVRGYSRDAVILRNTASDGFGAVNFNDNDAVGAVLRGVTCEAPNQTSSGVIFSNRIECSIINIRVSGGTAGAFGIQAADDRAEVTGCRVESVGGDEISVSGSNSFVGGNIVNGTVSISGANVEGTNVTY